MLGEKGSGLHSYYMVLIGRESMTRITGCAENCIAVWSLFTIATSSIQCLVDMCTICEGFFLHPMYVMFGPHSAQNGTQSSICNEMSFVTEHFFYAFLFLCMTLRKKVKTRQKTRSISIPIYNIISALFRCVFFAISTKFHKYIYNFITFSYFL